MEKNRAAQRTFHAEHRRQRSPARLGTLWAGCFVAIVACGGGGKPATDASQGDASLVGSPAPDAEFAPLRGGETVKLSALRGKVVLLDFWASWCVPCQEELPLLDEMATRLASKGIEFVGVSIDEEKADAEGFLERKKTWVLKLGHDPEQAGAKLFNPPKMPTSYVIDRSGIVRHVNAGFQREDVDKVEAQLNAAASAE